MKECIGENNLKTFKERFGIDLYDINIDYDKYSIEIGQDNRYTIKVNNGTRKMFIASKYNQERDIDKLINRIDFNDTEAYYIVIGFGMGYHISEVLKRISDETKVLVLEPDINILKCLSDVEDLTDVISDERLSIGVYTGEDDLNDILSQYMQSTFVNNLNVAIYGEYDKIYYQEVLLALKGIRKKYINRNLMSNTSRTVSDVMLKNYLKNIPQIMKSNVVNDLKDTFINKTAVIVSAGPSLSKNIDYLKRYQEKVLIITGIRNLKGMLDKGIKPHIVCIIDPREYMNEFEGINLEIPFLVCGQTNYELIKNHKVNNIFCNVVNLNIIDEITNKRYDRLPQGGSVAHLCTSVAVYMGCKNIIMIGQDLAYTDGRVHDKTASTEEVDKVAYKNFNKKSGYLVEGNNGELVFTDYMFDSFRMWFEDFIRINQQYNFINCTEGGAKINGTHIRPLSETLNELCREDINPSKILKDALKTQKKSDVNNALMIINKIIGILKKTDKKCAEGLKYCDKMLKYYKGNNSIKIDKVLEKLDLIDEFIQKNDDILKLVDILAFSYYEKAMRDPKMREKYDESELEKGKRLAERTKILYTGYIESSKNVIKILQEVILEID